MRIIKKKGFFCLFLLLFIALFIFEITNLSKTEVNTKEFAEIAILKTQKESEILNFENIIKNELIKEIDNTQLLKENINQKIVQSYKNKNILFLENRVSKKTEKITKEKLDLISQVIIYKPLKNIEIKRYFINQGPLNNLQLTININTQKLESKYLFSKEYKIEVICY